MDSDWYHLQNIRIRVGSSAQVCLSLLPTFSLDQLWGGDPVWTGYSRGLGCGLDSRKHLLGGKQPGPDRSRQTGRDHENYSPGWGGGASKSHCPRPSRRVRDIGIRNIPDSPLLIWIYSFYCILLGKMTILNVFPDIDVFFCWQYSILDWLGC